MSLPHARDLATETDTVLRVLLGLTAVTALCVGASRGVLPEVVASFTAVAVVVGAVRAHGRTTRRRRASVPALRQVSVPAREGDEDSELLLLGGSLLFVLRSEHRVDAAGADRAS